MKHTIKRLSPVSVCLVLFMFGLSGCGFFQKDDPALFESLPAAQTGITFENRLTNSSEFNIYKYRNFYNGGGIAVGDLTGNGLPDIYLVGNMVPNKLYENRGDFNFVDITEQAGVAGNKPWSTGVSLVDINGNGLLDIYVTNAGIFGPENHRNELFVNNGDGTFTERASEFGLDDPGYGIHAIFFDYDGDGYLDMYLLNNSNESVTDFDLSDNQREIRHELGGDKLFRNNGGIFEDVSVEAGIYGSEIGFSLSASVADVTRNGLLDIYVANDFFERDYLYINNGNGTFTDVLEEQFGSISAASMGSDIADLTNNGWPDIYVSDMLPMTDARTKLITTYENWELYSSKIKYGYHKQLNRNTFQLNNGDGTYSEVSRLANIDKTDWSWAVLMADFDHSGYNDIYVTNGLVQDITNLDYIEEISAPDMIRSIISGTEVDYQRLIERTPSTPINNVMFANLGGLAFEDVSEKWGVGVPGFSSGAAWGDLNGNGALDLIVNDVNGKPRIYKNRVNELHPERTWLKVQLKGTYPNSQAVGAQLEVWAGDSYRYREHMLQRGFQSSVEPGLHVGFNTAAKADSIRLRWPDGSVTRLYDIELPKTLTLSQEDAKPEQVNPQPPLAAIKGDHTAEFPQKLLTDITDGLNLTWSHNKYDYIDFNREALLVHKRSTEGPAMCAADINGNGLEDIYIGGARQQAGVLLIQNQHAGFDEHQPGVFIDDANAEDISCIFFDATGNSHPDLYVTSGGNSFSTGSTGLFDRLYFNDGNGNFTKAGTGFFAPPGGFSSNSAVAVHDFTGNGSLDLFVGERLKLFAVGLPSRGFLLANDGEGRFRDVTAELAPEFSEIGMITDAAWIDWTGDGNKELLIVGEWMTPRLFRFDGERFIEITSEAGFDEYYGWWNSIHAGDFNGNGKTDLILGNHGLNSHFKASRSNPVKMWVDDFEGNGIIDQVKSWAIDGYNYPVALRHDLLEEIPTLRSRFPDYASYSGTTVQEVFTESVLDRALKLKATHLESAIFWNQNGIANFQKLPLRVQFSPVFGVLSSDLTGDGQPEIITTGNLYDALPIAGSYDAGYGSVFRTDNERFETILSSQSGFKVKGSGRKIIKVTNSNGENLIVVGRNNDRPLFFKVNE